MSDEKKKKFIPDPEMLKILQEVIDTRKEILLRAQEYVRAEEIKLEYAIHRLELYKKGELHKHE